jgi:hypothetical protein
MAQCLSPTSGAPLHSPDVSLASRARVILGSQHPIDQWARVSGDAAPLPSRGRSFGLAHPTDLLEVTADQHPYSEREHFRPVGFPGWDRCPEGVCWSPVKRTDSLQRRRLLLGAKEKSGGAINRRGFLAAEGAFESYR